jgi:hypothetical protein
MRYNCWINIGYCASLFCAARPSPVPKKSTNGIDMIQQNPESAIDAKSELEQQEKII